MLLGQRSCRNGPFVSDILQTQSPQPTKVSPRMNGLVQSTSCLAHPSGSCSLTQRCISRVLPLRSEKQDSLSRPSRVMRTTCQLLHGVFPPSFHMLET